MSSVIRICDAEGNKYTGFTLSKNVVIRQLFPNGIAEGDKFHVGKFLYTVKRLYIDGFYDNRQPIHALDDIDAKIDAHIWVCCETKDPRILEGNINDETQSSIATDLGIEYNGFA